MIVTLYKKCIVSNSYTEVFDVVPRIIGTTQNTTVFEQYLNTLTKKIYDIDNAYITNYGTIVLPLDNPDIYEYNYMKMNDGVNARYYFIDDIIMRNEQAVIYYSEDIWHNYAGTMHIRNSLLKHSRFLTYGDKNISFYNLPYPYLGNNKLQITPLDTPNGRYKILFEIQLYNLSEAGEQSGRYCYVGVLKGDYYWFNYTELRLALITIQQGAGVYKNALNQYYEIGNFYVVPDYYPIESTFNLIQAPSTMKIGTESKLYDWYIINPATGFGDNKILRSYSITNNFKNIAVGTVTAQFDIETNGTNCDMTVTAAMTPFTIKFYLDIQNKHIDITDLYTVIIPFNSINGSETAQRQLARNVKNINGVMSIAGGVSNIIAGKVDLSTAMALPARGNRQKATKAAMIKSGRNEIMSSGENIIGGIVDLYANNQPVYQSNEGTFADSEGLINATNGLCVFSIIPDNEEQVNKIIDNAGYEVNEIVDNILQETDFETAKTRKNNVIQFGYINLYGNFTQAIAEQLKQILQNGVKIWYEWQNI